ncbi:MAG TPA: phosphate signaling complex protein PhoU [Bacteroidota bacterium]|nr:phosphate signaling complex protein PhoU [Bacteroidota bacterium]
MTMGPARSIDQLRRKLLTLGALVEESARRSVLALRGKDKLAAGVVVRSDAEIDTLEIAIEEDCVTMLAQPPLRPEDTRVLVAFLKINTDLERIGDLAGNIARHVEDLSVHEQALLPADLLHMADAALAMLRRALDSFVEADVAMARAVCAGDDEVDAFNREMYQFVQQRIMENPAMTGRLLNVLGIARHLERIADCATNIAEVVVYIDSGNIIRHGRNPVVAEKPH